MNAVQKSETAMPNDGYDQAPVPQEEATQPVQQSSAPTQSRVAPQPQEDATQPIQQPRTPMQPRAAAQPQNSAPAQRGLFRGGGGGMAQMNEIDAKFGLISKFFEMKEKGILTDEEFSEQKKKILDSINI